MSSTRGQTHSSLAGLQRAPLPAPICTAWLHTGTRQMFPAPSAKVLNGRTVASERQRRERMEIFRRAHNKSLIMNNTTGFFVLALLQTVVCVAFWETVSGSSTGEVVCQYFLNNSMHENTSNYVTPLDNIIISRSKL